MTEQNSTNVSEDSTKETTGPGSFSIPQSSILTSGIIAISLIAIVTGLFHARGVINVLLIAAFFAVIIYGPYSYLIKKLRFSRAGAMTATLLAVIALGFGMLAILVGQVKEFSGNLGRYETYFEKIITEHRDFLSNFSEFISFTDEPNKENVSENSDSVPSAKSESDQVPPTSNSDVSNLADDSDQAKVSFSQSEDSDLGSSGDLSDAAVPAETKETPNGNPPPASVSTNLSEAAESGFKINIEKFFSTITGFATKTVEYAGQGFIIFILLIFMLLEAAQLPLKIKSGIGEIGNDRLRAIAHDVQHYMRIKTIVSLIVGGLVTVFLVIMHVPYAFLWGVIAFLFNYVPNIGSVIAAIPPIILAFVDKGPLPGVIVIVAMVAINCVMGYVFEPRMMGKGLDISPLVVLISLVVWSAILGPIGMFLSPPLAVICKIILQQFPETRWIATLMANGAPEDELQKPEEEQSPEHIV